MGITSVKEKPASRTASYTFEGERSYKRSFIVITSDKYDGPLEVAQAVVSSIGIDLGGSYVSWNATEYDNNAKCKTISVNCQDDGGKTWSVDYEFGKISLESQEDDNPLNRAPEISYDSQNEDELVDFDVNGDAVLNTAGLPLDPPLTRNAAKFVLNISRNEASFPSYAYSSINKTNSDTFYGQSAGKWLLLPIQATGPHFENNTTFYKVNYSFAFNEDGWKKKILSQGLQELNEDEDGWVNIKDDDDNDITAAVPLDSDGKKLAPDGTPVELEFEVYTATAFSAFGL